MRIRPDTLMAAGFAAAMLLVVAMVLHVYMGGA